MGFSLLPALDLFPLPEDLGRGSRRRVSEDMRVSARHLLGDPPRDIADRERACLRADPREKDDLKEQIAELLAQRSGLAGIDRLNDVVGFFQQISAQVARRLLAVPRAAVRAAQTVHQRNQGVEFLHAAILYCQLVFSGFGHYVVMESK